LQEVFRIAQNHSQYVVKIVSHTACQLPDGIQLLSLTQLFGQFFLLDLGFFTLRDILDDAVCPHQGTVFKDGLGSVPNIEFSALSAGKPAFDFVWSTVRHHFINRCFYGNLRILGETLQTPESQLFCFGISRIDIMQTVEFIGPKQFTRAHVVFPATHLAQGLRTLQQVLVALQSFQCLFPRDDLLLELRHLLLQFANQTFVIKLQDFVLATANGSDTML